MEGLIILFVIIGVIQKIAERFREGRQGKSPREVPTQNPQRSQTEGASSDPFDVFKDWEQIFFPKETDEVTEDADDELYEEPFAREQPVITQKQPVNIYERADVVQTYQQGIRPQFPKAEQTLMVHNDTDGEVAGNDRARLRGKLQVDRDAIRQGILWSEVLAAPKSSLHWRKYSRGSSRG